MVQTEPEMQPVVDAQVCPFLLLHAPAASQVPGQRALGSSMFTAATQAWLALQDLHCPAQSLLVQQPPAAMQVVVPPTVHDCMLAGQE